MFADRYLQTECSESVQIQSAPCTTRHCVKDLVTAFKPARFCPKIALFQWNHKHQWICLEDDKICANSVLWVQLWWTFDTPICPTEVMLSWQCWHWTAVESKIEEGIAASTNQPTHSYLSVLWWNLDYSTKEAWFKSCATGVDTSVYLRTNRQGRLNATEQGKQKETS